MAATRVRPSPIRSTDLLCGFVESAVMPGSRVVTDDWSAYGGLRARGFDRHAIAERGDPEVAEEFLPIVHLVFSNLKNWRHLSWRKASPSLSQRVYVPLQPPVLPLQRLPLLARNRRSGTNLPPSYIPARGGTLHIVTVCPNRIGTVVSILLPYIRTVPIRRNTGIGGASVIDGDLSVSGWKPFPVSPGESRSMLKLAGIFQS